VAKETKKDQLRISTDAPGTKFEVPGPDDLDEADAEGVPYADLCDPRSKYSPQKKSEVVAAYYIWGNSIAAADKTGVNAATIRWWKASASWWEPLSQKFWNNKHDELIGGYTNSIDLVMSHVADAVRGEPIYKTDKKTGEVTIVGYKKPSLRDLVMAAAIMQDKRAQLQGMPAAITAKSTADSLKEVFEKFEKDAEEIKKKRGKKSGKEIIPESTDEKRVIN
jgi:hypothetical protein